MTVTLEGSLPSLLVSMSHGPGVTQAANSSWNGGATDQEGPGSRLRPLGH